MPAVDSQISPTSPHNQRIPMILAKIFETTMQLHEGVIPDCPSHALSALASSELLPSLKSLDVSRLIPLSSDRLGCLTYVVKWPFGMKIAAYVPAQRRYQMPHTRETGPEPLHDQR